MAVEEPEKRNDADDRDLLRQQAQAEAQRVRQSRSVSMRKIVATASLRKESAATASTWTGWAAKSSPHVAASR
jgi:hypothetical protein